MNNQSKYSLNIIIRGIVLFSMIFTSCLIARAESTSQVIIKESHGNTIKHAVRPSRKNSKTGYDIKIGPVKTIKPKIQNKAPDRSKRKHGEAVSSSDSGYKTEIKIFPIDKESENMKTIENRNGRRQRSHSKKSEYSGKVVDISVSTSKLKDDIESKPDLRSTKKISLAVSLQKSDKKYDIEIGPNKALDTEQPEKIQSPISERIKVTRVRSWKLDESGNKTKEKIIDNKNVIKGINQP